MSKHNKNLLETIQNFCDEYLEKKINLLELELYVSAVHSNFENDIDPKITDTIGSFVGELEEIRFMCNTEKQHETVANEIHTLNSFINKYKAQ